MQRLLPFTVVDSTTRWTILTAGGLEREFLAGAERLLALWLFRGRSRIQVMPWAGEIKEAEDRMYQANDALLADVESGQPYNADRRHALLANLKQAQDEFFKMVAQLRA